MCGLIPHVAPRVGDLDPVVFLALVEGIVCESQETAEQIQALYDDAKPPPPPPPLTRGQLRRIEVHKFMETGGVTGV